MVRHGTGVRALILTALSASPSRAWVPSRPPVSPPASGGRIARSDAASRPPPTTLSASVDGDDGKAPAKKSLPVPFFAAFSSPPDSAVPDSSGGSGSGGGPSGTTATVTTRLPLGALFDSRDYIFTAASNLRGYEWTVKEADELLDDLTDWALGEGGEDGSDGAVISGPNVHQADYELSQIVLVPMDWDTGSLGLGARYDVHDGQQRLVTVCLLLSAIRESFRSEGKGGDDTEGTVEELTAMLNPPKVRKDPVLRIELRKRDNEMLRRILVPELATGEDGAVGIDLPSSKNWASLSPTSRRILENYGRLSSRVSDLSAGERVALLDYLVERVYLLVCVPETGRIARNIVMAQGKGMDIEPIDDFKGLVCFRYTLEEDDMYKTFDKWDDLAATPPKDAEAANGRLFASVGRKTVSDACMTRATSSLRSKIRKNDEVYALERWLRQDLVEKGGEGKTFFAREIEPASAALGLFREGGFDSFSFPAVRGVPISKAGGKLGKTVAARLQFLRSLTTAVPSTREVEMVVLDLLLRAEGEGGRKPFTLEGLDECLCSLEIAALWMAVQKPSSLKRHKMCFGLLDAIDATPDADGTIASAGAFSEAERASLRSDLDAFEFGATASGKKIASALLERLNAHVLEDGGVSRVPEGIATQQLVEHVLPRKSASKYWKELWSEEEEKEAWTHRLGNLALLSHKITVREGNRAFNEKRVRYEKEIWPLTQTLSVLDVWDKDTLMGQQEEILNMVADLWGL